jgi:hypothetical protein
MKSRCNLGDLPFLFKMSLKMRLKSRTISSLSWVVNSLSASGSTNLEEAILCRKIFLELMELRLMKIKWERHRRAQSEQKGNISIIVKGKRGQRGKSGEGSKFKLTSE